MIFFYLTETWFTAAEYVSLHVDVDNDSLCNT